MTNDDKTQDGDTLPTQALTTTPEASSKERAVHLARMSLEPALQCALTMSKYSALEGVDYCDLAQELEKTMQPIHDGDYSKVEAIMFTQAAALNAIFGFLSRKAITGGYNGSFRSEYLELALKSQRQSLNTLAALRGYRSISSPAVAVQINNANGSPEQTKPKNEVLTMDNGDG